MPLHLRRRPTQRSSASPVCPTGGGGTGRFLCLSSSTMARHSVRRRFANSTRRARHKRCSIYVPVYFGTVRSVSGTPCTDSQTEHQANGDANAYPLAHFSGGGSHTCSHRNTDAGSTDMPRPRKLCLEWSVLPKSGLPLMGGYSIISGKGNLQSGCWFTPGSTWILRA